ncbi:MAG TPA: hypothetical protein ENO06_02720 [Methanolinea sp.]|nr:hypothetical protein [Methanolinea sp.]
MRVRIDQPQPLIRMVVVSYPNMRTGLACFMIVVFLCSCGCIDSAGDQGEPTPHPTPGVVETTHAPQPEETTLAAVSEEGPIQFYPGGQYHVGDRIVMSGTTNLHPGNRLLVEITSVSFSPTNKSEESAFSGISDVVTVMPGPDDRNNTWSCTLDTTELKPDTYSVLVSGITTKTFRKSTSFELLA